MSPEIASPSDTRFGGRFFGRRLLIAVTGGIAAYKTCFLVRDLIREGAEVQVLMSRSGTEFVSPLTFATLSGREVIAEMFPAIPPTDPVHLSPARWGEALVVAPATADFIGKLAHGLANDIPSTVAMAFQGAIIIAPAMNPAMWASPAVQANIDLLRTRGVEIVGPETGEMGGVFEHAGLGRMSEPADIIDRLEFLLCDRSRLGGFKILVTSGPTREALDPVRYLSNFSSGKMGDAIAREAVLRGAEVFLVRGRGATGKPPAGATIIEVENAAGMAGAVKDLFPKMNALIMAAAVADWTPTTPSKAKIKKSSGGLTIEWQQTEDILAWAGKNKSKQVVVGFALETTDHLKGGREKLESKSADVIVLNDPTRADSAFGGTSTRLTLLSKAGDPQLFEVMTKASAAGKLLEEVEKILRNA